MATLTTHLRQRAWLALAAVGLLASGSIAPSVRAEAPAQPSSREAIAPTSTPPVITPPTSTPPVTTTPVTTPPAATSPAATPQPTNPQTQPIAPPIANPANPATPAALPVKLVLRLRERRVYVYRGNRVEASYPVAIGKPSTPTPTGTFRVFQMIKDPIWRNPWTGQVTRPGANSALGLRWIGFNQLSNGIIGFHGTPTVNSIGRAASNGCVRMRNEHVVELFDKVHMGATVVVEP
ncbi:MAG: L,D-transpeptidase [Oscillatoriales cyanobacterium]|nr:MAG: L,D-transpeptidase [Oscillatoriales cyanobacterium]